MQRDSTLDSRSSISGMRPVLGHCIVLSGRRLPLIVPPSSKEYNLVTANGN